MKKIHLILFISLLTLTYSCSNNDDSIDSQKYKFKVTIEVPDGSDFELSSTIIGASANNNEGFKNLITLDETYPLKTDLTTGLHQFESINNVYGFNLAIEADTSPGDNDTIIILKVYRDNKIFYNEDVSFGPTHVELKFFNYVDGNVISTSN